MKLRTKLLLGYAGFVLALGVLGAWSARTLSQMSAVSGRIIAENYDSVVAAQDMKESLERQDSAALFELLGAARPRARGRRPSTARGSTPRSTKAAANITEVGEPEIDRGDPARPRRVLPPLRRVPRARRRPHGRSTFASLEPRFNAVRADCDRLLRLNQEAMRRKADAASRIARRWFFITLALALVLMVVGVAVEFSLSNAILGPVAAADRRRRRGWRPAISDAAVPVRSADEIGALAVGFNRMAERIRELRRSDLGKLLVAQQTTEAAIDSLYDPVDRHRQRRARDADQPGRRAAVRRAGRRARQADRRGRARPAHRAGGRRRAALAARRRRRRAPPRCCRGPSTARGARSASARRRCGRRRPAGRRRHAARGHHAPERDQPAEVRVHRRRVARAADAAHQRADGHPPAARGRGRHAGRAPAGDPPGVPRGHRAARSPDARAARSVEDRVGRGRRRVLRADAPVDARRARPSSRCGCRWKRRGIRLEVDAPPDLPHVSRRSRARSSG